MPASSGTMPPHERVDLKMRNGSIVRNTEPRKWRWKNDDRFPPDWAFDIASYQEVKT